MSADHENDMTPHGVADFGGAEPRMQGPANSGTETSSSDLEKAWGRVTERLRRDIGDAAWRNWIKPLRVSRLQDGTLTLEAGSSLARDRVSSQYADRLRVISAAEYGAKGLVKILEKWPDTDAIMCANDSLAMGVWCEAMRRGISIPEKIALTGFGDFELAGAAALGLTTVQIDGYQMGKITAELIHNYYSGGIDVPTITDIHYKIIERHSA